MRLLDPAYLPRRQPLLRRTAQTAAALLTVALGACDDGDGTPGFDELNDVEDDAAYAEDDDASNSALIPNGEFVAPSVAHYSNTKKGFRLNTSYIGTHFLDRLITTGIPSEQLQPGEALIESIKHLPSGKFVVLETLTVSHGRLYAELAGGGQVEHEDFMDTIWTINFNASGNLMNAWLTVQAADEKQSGDYDFPGGTYPGAFEHPFPRYKFVYAIGSKPDEPQQIELALCTEYDPDQGASKDHEFDAVVYRDIHVEKGSHPTKPGEEAVRVLHRPGSLYLGCTNGAVGKAGTERFGYRPELDFPPFYDQGQQDPIECGAGCTLSEQSITLFEIAVRMIRAEYNDDTVSHTAPGNFVATTNIYDPYFGYKPERRHEDDLTKGASSEVHEASSLFSAGYSLGCGLEVEALWGPTGAMCIGVTRDDSLPSDYPSLELCDAIAAQGAVFASSVPTTRAHPAIACDAYDECLLVSEFSRQTHDEGDVPSLRFDSLTPRKGPRSLTLAGAGAQRNPALAHIGGDDYLVVWEQTDGGQTDIRAQIITGDGGTNSSVITIADDDNKDERHPSVACSDGLCAITYEYIYAPDDIDVYARSLRPLAPYDPQVTIVIANSTANERSAVVTASDADVFDIAWQYEYEPGDNDIYTTRLSQGIEVGTRMIAATGHDETNPVVRCFTAQGCTYGWEHHYSETDLDIYSRALVKPFEAGEQLSPVTALAESTRREATPRLSLSTADGSIVAAWEADTEYGLSSVEFKSLTGPPSAGSLTESEHLRSPGRHAVAPLELDGQIRHVAVWTGCHGLEHQPL